MGRQITVELSALEVLCHLDHYEEQFEVPYGDTLATESLRFVTVCTPQWQSITLSVFGRDGCVDCRGPGSPNYWLEEWLIANQVPYLAG